ncbi:MAG TPA: arsenic resistance N-acetyltransferase ArsN2 [Candidatus Binatia bacterium]|nr:arsenic resistance N-acetyltransferase ArsN2 [Candidatus Binatia bacterium]
MTLPRIGDARAEDDAAIRGLLSAVQLPVTDLDAAAWQRFQVARDGGRIVGSVALDRAGDAALLRSLAVAPETRRHGLGRALVQAAEARARELDVMTLYLLTTTAAPFFERLGYVPLDRARAPQAIAALPQFAGVCPSSAALLRKRLAPGAAS